LTARSFSVLRLLVKKVAEKFDDVLASSIGRLGIIGDRDATFDTGVVESGGLCIAGFGFFAVLPVFWTFPTAFLSGAGAAAGIAAVNSIGNLGGYFGPQAFGLLRDYTGSDLAGLLFLAGSAFVGMVIVFLLGYNPAISRNLAAGTADVSPGVRQQASTLAP
jgi:hypothetical protein